MRLKEEKIFKNIPKPYLGEDLNIRVLSSADVLRTYSKRYTRNGKSKNSIQNH